MSSAGNESRIAEFTLHATWPARVDPKPLTEESHRRAQAIYECLSPYLNTDPEQFKLNFERDENSEQEIRIWGRIASAQQTFLQRAPSASDEGAERAFKAFLLMSIGAPRPSDIPDPIWKSLKAIYERR